MTREATAADVARWNRLRDQRETLDELRPSSRVDAPPPERWVLVDGRPVLLPTVYETPPNPNDPAAVGALRPHRRG